MEFLKKIFGQNKDEQLIYKEIIEKAVDICFLNYQDPDRIADEIEKLTDNKNDALMLYLFIPHVFCRIFLPEIQYSKFYIIVNKDEQDKQVNFSDSILFNEMLTVINNNWDSYVGRDIMKTLFHSGDFRAANQMLGKGSKLENLKAIPPRITDRDSI
ncbi:hypothetical protein KXD93_15155 [Mucilaginibacter sp. BJC16-A38]|uniref:hypothetical protein n=1 Tax=Mucilaginibacter phenanthrenivorans TaxID=1234842 RepID=UPI0021579EFC|nr:hypothetical protein [Mucilaginibacter phenanthrenivorans]MCR8558994.1 hypothetical protein [Mucilaginibacter phenanthrenivorans]